MNDNNQSAPPEDKPRGGPLARLGLLVAAVLATFVFAHEAPAEQTVALRLSAALVSKLQSIELRCESHDGSRSGARWLATGGSDLRHHFQATAGSTLCTVHAEMDGRTASAERRLKLDGEPVTLLVEDELQRKLTQER